MVLTSSQNTLENITQSKAPRSDEVKITIITTYSLRNKGDEMLLRGTIDSLKEFFSLRKKNPIFYVFSVNPASDEKIFHEDGVQFLLCVPPPSWYYKSRWDLILTNLKLFFVLLLYKFFGQRMFVIFRKEVKDTLYHLSTSEFVLARSIDQLTDVFGLVGFLKNIIQIELTKRLNGKVIIHAHTIYVTRRGLLGAILKRILKRTLKGTSVSVREKYSLEYLSSIDIKSILIPPPAIWYMAKVRQNIDIMDKKYDILLIPRLSLRQNNENDNLLSRFYANLLDSLLSKGYSIAVMGQSFEPMYSDNDSDFINKIKEKSKCTFTIITPRDLDDFVDAIAKSRICVSERAFSIFASLSLGVPTIGIDPYGGKNWGLMKLFNFENYCISQEERYNSKEIYHLIHKALNNENELRLRLNERFKQLHKEYTDRTQQILKVVIN